MSRHCGQIGYDHGKREHEYCVDDFWRTPFPPFRPTPFPLPNSSVASPAAHQKNSGVSSSYRKRNAVAWTSEKNYRVPWGAGRESESISSGNAGMDAAVLSPGGVCMDKNKNKKVVDIHHFHALPLPTPIRVC